jgi:hypothetical protein
MAYLKYVFPIVLLLPPLMLRLPTQLSWNFSASPLISLLEKNNSFNLLRFQGEYQMGLYIAFVASRFYQHWLRRNKDLYYRITVSALLYISTHHFSLW